MLELVFRVFQCVWHIGKHPFWAVTTKNTTPKQKNNSSTLTQKRTHPRCNFCKIWSYTFSRTISIQNSNPEEKICDELCIYNCQLKKNWSSQSQQAHQLEKFFLSALGLLQGVSMGVSPLALFWFCSCLKFSFVWQNRFSIK